MLQNVVEAHSISWKEFVDAGDEFANEPMFLANPAALGLWHAANSPSDWGLPLVTTYSATIGGLGRSLARTIAFNFM